MDRKVVDVSSLSLSFSLFLSLSLSFSTGAAKRKESADRSGKYFTTPETWTVECNCRRIFANIWFSQVWKHSSYTYAIPWWFQIWAWLRHEFLETAIPWWSTSKFWPRHELGMSLLFDCTSSWQKSCICSKNLHFPEFCLTHGKVFKMSCSNAMRSGNGCGSTPRTWRTNATNTFSGSCDVCDGGRKPWPKSCWKSSPCGWRMPMKAGGWFQ